MWILIILISILLICLVLLYKVSVYYMNRMEEEIDKVQKLVEFYEALVRWVEISQEKKKLKEYFYENNYETIAIYGMKELGVLLYKELKQEKLQVLCAIDKNPDDVDCDFTVVKPSKENIPKVDVIVVTAIHYYDSIYSELEKITSADIVSIEDILWGI